MIITKQFVTDNGKFELTLQASSRDNIYKIAYLTPFINGEYLEAADNEEWLFDDLRRVLKYSEKDYTTDFLLTELGVANTHKTDHTQLLEILEEGQKWYNKPVEKVQVDKDNCVQPGELIEISKVNNTTKSKVVEKLQKQMKQQDLNKARRYNSGKLRYSLLDFDAVEEIIKVLEYGAFKYSIFEEIETSKRFSGKDLLEQDPNIQTSLAMKNYKLISSGRDNWKNDLDFEGILDSAMRHLTARIKGEEFDQESGLKHMAHLGCNVIFALYYELKNK